MTCRLALPRHLTAPLACALAVALAATGSIGGAALGATPGPIAPHAATYGLKLAKARAQSEVVGVDGKMTIALKDACDGWTTEQKFEIRFVYAEGEAQNFVTSYTTWEAKDGSAYRFNVRKTINGETDEELRGEATSKARSAGGRAAYVKPEPKEVAMAAGTFFPTAHTAELLRLAKVGENFLGVAVFDGGDAGGATPISAVIGAIRDSEPKATGGGALRARQAHPVHLAFFPLDPQKALPEYESTMMLQTNGIVQSMTIDYGDFKVDMQLEKLDTVPAPAC